MTKPIRLGVVGYNDQNFDRQKAIDILFQELALLPKGSVVVGSETNLGVPGLAYSVAYRLDLNTVGISCSKAAINPGYPCDKVIRVGDESQTFLEFCDQFLRIGGGIEEIEKAKKMNKPVKEFDL